MRSDCSLIKKELCSRVRIRRKLVCPLKDSSSRSGLANEHNIIKQFARIAGSREGETKTLREMRAHAAEYTILGVKLLCLSRRIWLERAQSKLCPPASA